MSEIYGFDAYAPREIAQRVETVGVVKARLPLLPRNYSAPHRAHGQQPSGAGRLTRQDMLGHQ